MTIGLTSEQMLNTFSEHVKQRAADLIGQVQAAKANESPKMAQLLSTLEEMFPNLNQATFAIGVCIGLSLFDVLLANNEQIAKSVLVIRA